MKKIKLFILTSLLCFHNQSFGQNVDQNLEKTNDQKKVEQTTQIQLVENKINKKLTGKNDFNFSVGFASDVGIAGFSLTHFFNEKQALNFTSGADFNGHIRSLNYHYYDQVMNIVKTGTFMDQCWFAFECQQRPFLQVGLTQMEAAEIEFNNQNGGTSIYKTTGNYMANLGYGFRSEFKSNWINELQVNYRQSLNKNNIKLKTGTINQSDVTSIQNRQDGLGINFSVGYNY